MGDNIVVCVVFEILTKWRGEKKPPGKTNPTVSIPRHSRRGGAGAETESANEKNCECGHKYRAEIIYKWEKLQMRSQV